LIFALLLGCVDETKIEHKQIQEVCSDEIIVSETAKNITYIQKRTAIQIEKNFNKLEIPKNTTAAAIVNAIAESQLQPTVIGDNGNSVGLFQLNKFGLGSNMSVEHRKSAYINSIVVGVEILQNRRLLKKDEDNATIPTLTAIIVEDIMRPKMIEEEKIIRTRLAKTIFPNRIELKCTKK
jgi:hypothetical protein